MRKISIIFSLLMLLSHSYGISSAIKLESPILAQIDGLPIGITGEVIGLIKRYQSQILAMLKGTKVADTYIGAYEYENKKYTVQGLVQQEETFGHSPCFSVLLQQIRSDFEHISEPFRQIIHGVKPFMAILIEESLNKRNRLESVLYVWSKTNEKDEYELFDLHIKTIKDFEFFLVDLYSFLSDLVHSCPRACTQFKEHVEKFSQAKSLIARYNLSKEQEANFLKYLNTKIASFSKEEVTKEKIHALYQEFKTHSTTKA